MTEIVNEFTTQVPQWSPHLEPINLENATALQLEALEVTPSNTKISDYVLVLAHDPESLIHRNPLFNTIMYGGPGGLSRSDRELGAIGASEFNKCIYCTAVHASRYIDLTTQTEVIDEIFEQESNADLPAREQAIFNYSIALSETPSSVSTSELNALEIEKLTDLEILDLTLSAAIFCWANRLMETLGQPVKKS
jgi:uncharacterized peroxidase-related enzyme